MAFTTWREFKQQLLDDLADEAWRTIGSYTLPSGRQVSYRSLADWKKLWDLASDEEAKESGVAPYIGRMYAKQGGRG